MVQVHVPQGVEVRVLSWAPNIRTSNPRKSLNYEGFFVPLELLGRQPDETSKSVWKQPSDIKAQYRSASILKNRRVVFNIKGQ